MRRHHVHPVGSTIALSTIVLLTMASAASAQQQPAPGTGQPPVVKDLTVVSLHRARPDWEVTTSFCVVAEDPDSAVPTFNVVSPPANGTVDCTKPCTLRPTDDPATANVRSTRCDYQPSLGFTGPDAFRIVAVDTDELKSPAATVAIDVRNEGLRWELITAASTGLTSDRDTLQDIPKVIGKNLQDFLFKLNWQTASPRQDPILPRVNAPVSGVGKLSRMMNVVFQTGLQSGSAAVEAEALAPVNADTNPSAASAGTATSETSGTKQAANQRQFTAGGTVQFTWVLDADGQGTFFEFGFIGKGAVDVFLDGASVEEVSAGKFVRLLREGRTFIRSEGGGRIGLKQLKERSSTVRTCRPPGQECPKLEVAKQVQKSEKLLHPANLDDLVYLELFYQRDNALGGLDAAGNNPRNRLGLRIAAQPMLASLPGRPKFLIGVEVTRAFMGGDRPIARIFYGLNLSGNKLF